jgi:hypothetical protein
MVIGRSPAGSLAPLVGDTNLTAGLVAPSWKPIIEGGPPSPATDMTKEQLVIVWDTIHKECEKLGISVITGHTARYEHCDYPMVGGETIVGADNYHQRSSY